MTAIAKNIFLALVFISCNFYEIDPGQFYRSAQLNRQELGSAIEQYKIKTIINLRGENPKKKWYRQEREVALKYDVELIDIAMNSRRLPHRADLLKLLDAFKHAPRPILIHCAGGADRTGEASALYQMIYMGLSKEDALKMLTTQYLHFPHKKPAKRYFISEVWQNEQWAYESYDPCPGNYDYYPVRNPHCPPPADELDQLKGHSSQWLSGPPKELIPTGENI